MSNNPDLGYIACDGCDAQAAIRRQRTGKQYLYLHCKNCGMDKRSGTKLQAKWQRAIDGKQDESRALSTELATPVNVPEKAGEWQPNTANLHNEITTEQGQNDAKNENSASTGKPEHERSDSESGGGIGGFILGALTICAAVAGLRRA